jgi:raffinose/stachyose/melibiose transport system permease protein
MGEMKFKSQLIFYMLPAFLIYTIFFVYPFTQTFYYSMFEWTGFGVPTFIGIQNYLNLLKDDIFTSGIGRILIWALLAILFKTGVALILASILRKQIKGAKLFIGVYFLPVVLSSAAIALMFTLMYDYEIGPVNWFLNAIGLGELTRPWLGDANTAFYAVVAVPIFHSIGYHFIILLAGLKNIPEELYESAVIDGANAWDTCFKITIPQIWPILQICIILAINGAMKSFDYIFIMTRGGPGTSTEVPATYMYESIFISFQYGYGTSIAISIFLFTISIILIFRAVTNFKNN